MQKAKLSKLWLRLAATALVGTIALAPVGFSAAADAASRSYLQQGPYHEDVLPNGTVTGPIAPDANGG